MTLVHSTVSGNNGANGGGIYFIPSAGGLLSIENSIVAGNTTGGRAPTSNRSLPSQ